MGLMDILKGVTGGKASGSATGAASQGAAANPADMLGGLLGGSAGGAGNPLGGLLGGLLGGSGGGNPLLKMLLPMLLGGGAGGALGKLGGLGGLIGAFSKAGMGTKANSWVSTGENIPVTGDEVQQALGDDVISEMSTETGLPAEEVKTGLAGMLPNLVNQLTPNGGVPDAAGLQQAAKGLDLSSILGGLAG